MEINTKLIWNGNYPDPYESGFNIFSKILQFNLIRPKTLAPLISKPGKITYHINFWIGDWIDFNKFSEIIGVDQICLKRGFLDQLGFLTPNKYASNTSNIRQCQECLKYGYHCIFFELPFITHCPWHLTKLTNGCHQCVETIYNKGLTTISKHDHLERFSYCKHIRFVGDEPLFSNMFSDLQRDEIKSFCDDFLQWWVKVHENKMIAEFLSKNSYGLHTSSKLQKFLNAAENLAGECPWFIDHPRQKVRNHKWVYKPKDVLPFPYHVRRGSNIDAIYRSLKRFIFKKYLKPHKKCWNELSNISYEKAQLLDSKKSCTVALAYASWRLSIEEFINIEVFKSNRFSDKELQIFSIPSNFHIPSSAEISSLMYGYFFYIWDEINFGAKHSRFCIIKDQPNFNFSKFAIGNDGYEWQILIPDPKKLIFKSLQICSKTVKFKNWMYTDLISLEEQKFRVSEGESTRTLFRLESNVIGKEYLVIMI